MSLSEREAGETYSRAPTGSDVDVSVVIAAYNEEVTIGDTVSSVRQTLDAAAGPYEIIVVDDGSTDETGRRAAAAGATVLPHAWNQGQGAALRTGIAGSRGSLIAFIDGDGTYPAHEMPRLLDAARRGEFEQAIGHRTKEAGHLKALRYPVKLVLRRFARMLTGQEIGDLNSGMRVITRQAALRYMPLIPDGFSNSTTLTLASLAHRGRVAFLPIDYFPRTNSRSKFRPVGDTYNLLLAIIRMVMYVDPLRVLLPIAAFFLFAGFAKGITDLFRFDLHVAASSALLFITGIQVAAIALIADLIVRRTR